MAKSPRKVIVTCAITGGIHTPSMSPHLPVQADEIAAHAIEAAEAGAATRSVNTRPNARFYPQMATAGAPLAFWGTDIVDPRELHILPRRAAAPAGESLALEADA